MTEPDSLSEVLSGARPWGVWQADGLDFLRALPEGSCDLVLGSPPYEAQRTYAIDFDRKGQAWVDWMVEVFRAASRACKGLVCMVVEGATKGYRWSATPALLMADLHRAGFNLRKPPLYHRVGVPGSGGPDWLRNDYEFCVCVSRPGKLPWSDNTAMGHAPKWAPGGEMSHRVSSGARVNQWGGHKGSSQQRRRDGTKQPPGRPSHRSAHGVGDTANGGVYEPPAIANPGNVIHCNVGGNQMGDPLCHQNEAPFPEKLCEFFVRSFAPVNGLVLDPFAGSGTTLAVARRWRRRSLGCDVRESQVALARRRVAEVTPDLFPV
jgi:hypothetical protein